MGFSEHSHDRRGDWRPRFNSINMPSESPPAHCATGAGDEGWHRGEAEAETRKGDVGIGPDGKHSTTKRSPFWSIAGDAAMLTMAVTIVHRSYPP